MTLRLVVKNQKPFTEITVDAKGIKNSIIVGCKVYSHSELKEVRKAFRKSLTSDILEMKVEELEQFERDGDKTDSSFYITREAMNAEIEELTDEQTKELINFYKSQVTHIKNAVLELEDGDKVIDIVVPDSRTAKPVEGIWSTPEECLAVLLDTYLDHVPFRESLTAKISAAVFNLETKPSAKLKN